MFKVRSYQKEFLDDSDVPKDLLFQNLKELELINKYLGGHACSLKGLRKTIAHSSGTYRLIDIGCGGGDSLKAIAKWSSSNGYKISLTGIDLKQDCISYSRGNCKTFPEINFRCDDFRNVFAADTRIDVIHASLFCHHFKESEIVEFIKLCSRKGAVFVINDLERNPLAYYSIKFLTGLFSKSSLVKNDAPLSVLRGFRKTEWKAMLQRAGIKRYEILSSFAFRHLIIAYPNEQ